MEQHSGSNETADVDASAGCDNGESSTHATQITSIDGFFNRKRGRPPKNRFVEVYKSAQLSPQAIFTSFKLEKNDQTVGSGLTTPANHAEESATSLRLGSTSAPTPTDLTPSRNRKRARIWTVDSGRSLANVPTMTASNHEHSKTLSMLESQECRSTCQLTLSTPEATAATASKHLEKVSVVRAAGTFYPENASAGPSAEAADSSAGRHNSARHVDCSWEQPEDLSMRATKTESSNLCGEPGTDLKLLQFKQLIDLYQRQVLLPSFLAAASCQPAGLDMRLLLENAAQQKMLLINAAAASAVAAAATAAAATTADESTPTITHTAIHTPAVTSTSLSTVPRTVSKRARDQDIPTGYLKFRFNEDCNFERCGYRNHQSHFHCNRRDCHYSFCDKTRFVQHTARHERMDTLMGEDFQQFRANMHCGVPDCCYTTTTSPNIFNSRTGNCYTTTTSRNVFNSRTEDNAVPKKTSHFHCRKCDYVCTDSNKVVAHRRLHMRLEYVRSAGFRKIASNESCETPTCSYAQRHTHYHCTTCDCSVLSRAQLASHKHRSSPPIKQVAANASGVDLEAYS